MKELEPKSTRVGALVVLGVVLFNPPLMEVFNAGPTREVAGIPLLFFYLFAAWALLIGLLVLVIEGRPRGRGERAAVARPNRGARPTEEG